MKYDYFRHVFLGIILTIISVSFQSIDDSSRKGQIRVELIDCRTNENINYGKLVLKLNSAIVKELIWGNDGSNNLFRNLEAGKYSIIYKSIFERKESVDIDLYNGQSRTVYICVDKFTDDFEEIDKLSLIDKVQEMTSYKIICQSAGCFNSSLDSIHLQKKNDFFYLVKDNDLQKLNYYQLMKVRDFEMKLINTSFSSGCTTVDHYKIIIDNEEIFYNSDYGCDWNGFLYLKEIIF